MAHLINIKAGKEVQIEKTSDYQAVYKMLMAYGIFEGKSFKVLRNDKWQQMILVESKGKRIAIRKKDAASIKVQLING